MPFPIFKILLSRLLGDCLLISVVTPLAAQKKSNLSEHKVSLTVHTTRLVSDYPGRNREAGGQMDKQRRRSPLSPTRGAHAVYVPEW